MTVLNELELASAGGATAASVRQRAILSALRFTPGVLPLAASAPTVTVATNGTATITSTVDVSKTTPNTTIPVTNAKIATVGTPLRAVNSQLFMGNSIQQDAANTATSRRSNRQRYRFLFDGPVFEAAFTNRQGRVCIMVDGEMVFNAQTEPRLPIQLLNDQNASLVKVDFGTNTPSLYASFVQNNGAPAVGGSGYVVGEVITMTGGTFTAPAKIKVTAINAGAVLSGQIVDPGIYSVFPNNNVAQGSTTGSGTGATWNLVSSARHSVRRMRRIEIITSGDNYQPYVIGINVGAQDCVQPWPVVGPRILFLGDSLVANTFSDWPTGGFADLSGQFLGLDDIWISGRSGEGYLQQVSGVKLRDRLINDVYAYTPDIIVTCMGYNDKAQDPTALQAEVQACHADLLTNLPNAFHFAMNAHRDYLTSLTPPANVTNAIAAGINAAYASYANRARFIDSVALGWDVGGSGTVKAPTGVGTSDFWISSDTLHMTQAGHERRAYLLAQAIYSASRSILLNI